MPPLINPSSIPRIGILREQLDYFDTSEWRVQEFRRISREFRIKFVSKQKREGISIRDWNSRDFDDIVESFLETEEHGRVFWPDDVASAFANKLKYSTDKELIKKVMRQYFWQLKPQQGKTNRRKKRKQSGDFEASTGRVPSLELGVEVDVGAASASGDDAEMPGTPRSSTFINQINSPVDVNAGDINPGSREAPSNHADERDISEDPFTDVRTWSSSNQATFPIMSTGVGQDGRQVAPIANMEPIASMEPIANMEPPAKRPRVDDRTSAHMSSKRAEKQPAGPRTTRASVRARKPRQLLNCATDEEVLAAAQSPERSSSPEIVENPNLTETNTVVAPDIYPPWSHGTENRPRATVEDVAYEDEDLNGYADESVLQMDNVTGLHQAEPSDSAAVAGPSGQVASTEAVLEPPIMVKPATRHSTPIPSISPLVPAESREVVDEMPVEHNDTAQAPSVGQSRVEFLYRVVCHYPERQSFVWKPEGSFRNKTLARLEEELSKHLEFISIPLSAFSAVRPEHARSTSGLPRKGRSV